MLFRSVDGFSHVVSSVNDAALSVTTLAPMVTVAASSVENLATTGKNITLLDITHVANSIAAPLAGTHDNSLTRSTAVASEAVIAAMAATEKSRAEAAAAARGGQLNMMKTAGDLARELTAAAADVVAAEAAATSVDAQGGTANDDDSDGAIAQALVAEVVATATTDAINSVSTPQTNDSSAFMNADSDAKALLQLALTKLTTDTGIAGPPVAPTALSVEAFVDRATVRATEAEAAAGAGAARAAALSSLAAASATARACALCSRPFASQEDVDAFMAATRERAQAELVQAQAAAAAVNSAESAQVRTLA